MTPLCAEIKTILHFSGMTYEQLGRKIGYNRVSVNYAITSNANRYNDNVINAIADYLCIDLSAVTPEPKLCRSSSELYREIYRQKACRDLTSAQIGAMAGVSKPTISRVLNGRMGLNTAIKVADTLGIPHEIKTLKEVCT